MFSGLKSIHYQNVFPCVLEPTWGRYVAAGLGDTQCISTILDLKRLPFFSSLALDFTHRYPPSLVISSRERVRRHITHQCKSPVFCRWKLIRFLTQSEKIIDDLIGFIHCYGPTFISCHEEAFGLK